LITRDVAQVGVGEESPHDAGQLLQPMKRADDRGLEIVGSGGAGASDPVVFDVLPDPLSVVVTVQVAMDGGMRARRLSAGRACSGWPSWDRAIFLLLARLGLRAGEVAALGLYDIDWRRGEITVCGKRGRRDRLPLPVDVARRSSPTCAAAVRGTRWTGRCSSAPRRPAGH
jgi:hypothetical protein